MTSRKESDAAGASGQISMPKFMVVLSLKVAVRASRRRRRETEHCEESMRRTVRTATRPSWGMPWFTPGGERVF